MEAKARTQTVHQRIVVGLPNLQDQIGLINRMTGQADELELERWEDIRQLLSDLYSQLQRQKQVTVYRLNNKNQTKAHVEL